MTANEARKLYYKNYRETHRKEISEKYKLWCNANKERLKKYKEEYWQRKAEQYEANNK